MALAAPAVAFTVLAPAGTAHAATGPAGITAKSAILLDSGTNKPLWGKAPDTRRQMASTTKVMTALVVLETKGLNLNKQITVKQSYRNYVARNGASTADLRTGDKLTVRQLLYGLMLPSGCDAAYALADAFGTGKSEAARTGNFISKMNAKASQLKLKNTRYDSFDGISKAGKNWTNTRDAAALARRAIGNSTLAGVVKATSTKQKATNGRVYTWYNTNQLLGSYKGAIGIKTGTGTAAGPCLVFAAKRGSRTVVGVILNDKNRYTDAKKMLDWAFKTKTAMSLRTLPAGAERD
ncbi:D-alanyl-D-alanine carboxypeptidase family protein [Streptomyces sp. NBC_01465]|uniref:D-alanyl-D-alanine carboxypeptidase family protein n=1 Tax=Streptomyces sp. NBC_01465 TaxID=2903878 RepID=UPI002E316105|nr:serine hydrolase [Streptomyces sp. NBC_01465]